LQEVCNIELDRLINGSDIIRFVKAHRIRKLGHTENEFLTDGKKNMRMDTNGEQTGIPRIRWLVNVCNDRKALDIKKQKEMALNRNFGRRMLRKTRDLTTKVT
jgi:hypothetical protein